MEEDQAGDKKDARGIGWIGVTFTENLRVVREGRCRT